MAQRGGKKRRRVTSAPFLLLSLDAGDARPLYRQAYDDIRAAIVAGRLRPGARLPASRALAGELGVARNTIALAYEQLRVEGYVEGRRGGGTRVCEMIPERFLTAGPGPGARRAEPAPTRSPRNRDGPAARETARLSSRGGALAGVGKLVMPNAGPARPFRLGVPELELFPSREWAKLTSRRWRDGNVVLGDGDPAGEPELRAAIAEYVVNSRGARCDPDQILVVTGAQQALDLCARLLLDPGDAAWMEEPGYQGARAALLAAAARIVPVRVDGEGLDVVAGSRAAPGARLAYVTPSHQFPLGSVLTGPRRLALLAWARRARAWIIEDDYDSEFRYAGRPLPCLQGLDEESRLPSEPARVFYIGTFNKTLAPGLRLGYVIVPEPFVDAFRSARATSDRHAPTIVQGVLADFIGEGHYARHLRRLRTAYAAKQEALLAAARSELSGLLVLEPDPAGLHLVGRLQRGITGDAAQAAALAAGVEVYPLSRFSHGPSGLKSDRLILGYAGFADRTLRAAVRRLAHALAGCR